MPLSASWTLRDVGERLRVRLRLRSAKTLALSYHVGELTTSSNPMALVRFYYTTANGSTGTPLGSLNSFRLGLLFHRHGLREIARLVHIGVARACRVICEQLQRHHMENR